MRSIQDVGLELFDHKPASVYAFLGPEYGIKCKYLNLIAESYENNVYEVDSVQSVISLMNTKHIIPLKPALYIVRYDESYIATLNSSSQAILNKCKMIGTLVMIYQTEKHCDKVAKYLPDVSVYLSNVDIKFIKKYLKSDFPGMNDRLIDLASICGSNYAHAKNICGCMNDIPYESFSNLSDIQICKLFGKFSEFKDSDIKIRIAAKDVRFLLNNTSTFVDDVDNLLYTILATMVELDKIWGNKYSDSAIKKYQKLWKREDIYYLFMQTYHQLKLRRTISMDDECQLIYIFSLLAFSSIPAIEEV